MSTSTRPKRIHFIGVCGTGMGPLAGLCKRLGHDVRGSDVAIYPPMSTQLQAWGIPVMPGYLPANVTWEDGRPPDLIVVGNICRRDNPEVVEAERLGIRRVSFPELLAEEFLVARHSVVVAGTHGKTTTASLCAWLLWSVGRNPGFLIGGVPQNFEAGHALGAPDGEFVVEGDEYDTAFFDKGPKFLHYRPATALLTSVEYDHADIYASLDAVAAAFEKFLALVPPEAAGGRIVVCRTEALAWQLASARAQATRVESYAVVDQAGGPPATWEAREVTAHGGGFAFSLYHTGDAGVDTLLGRFVTPLAGRHNLANAVGALAVVIGRGVPAEAAARALAEFRGVKRRQELRGVASGVSVVDDFAHHPTAVRETLKALRGRLDHEREGAPGRLIAVYEPRTATSRRNVFQAEYPHAFDAADRVIIARPHAQAGIAEGDRFDSQALVSDLRAHGRQADYGATIDGPEGIVATLAGTVTAGDMVVVMSTGGFEGLIDKLLVRLTPPAPGRP